MRFSEAEFVSSLIFKRFLSNSLSLSRETQPVSPQTELVTARVKKKLIELKVIFLEIVYLGLYSDKVWGFSIFSFCTPPGDIYRRLLLSSLGNFYSFSFDIIVLLFLVGSGSFCMYTLCTYYYYFYFFNIFIFKRWWK